MCAPAATCLAATVARRPDYPVNVSDYRLNFAKRSEEQSRAEGRIRQLFAVSEFDVQEAAYEYGWGHAVALGALNMLEYKAMAFRAMPGELAGSAEMAGRPDALGAELAWFLAAARTDPDLLPENQTSERGRLVIQHAWESLGKMARSAGVWDGAA